MIRIANHTFDAYLNQTNGEIEVLIPNGTSVSDEQLVDIKNSKLLEELVSNFGSEPELIGTYSLVDWMAVERRPNGLIIRWQTYRTTDIDQLKQDNEDLTAALLELAEIVGGNNG